MASLEGYQLLPIPEQVFLPSTNIGGAMNFFIPSQPLLQCLPPAPYTLLPGANPYPVPIFQNPDLPQFYEYSNQPNFQQYLLDTNENEDRQSITSSQGRDNSISNSSLKLEHWNWVEQLNFILRDIYR